MSGYERLPLTNGDNALVFLATVVGAIVLVWFVSRILTTTRLERMAEELADAAAATEEADAERAMWRDYAHALEAWSRARGMSEPERRELRNVIAARAKELSA